MKATMKADKESVDDCTHTDVFNFLEAIVTAPKPKVVLDHVRAAAGVRFITAAEGMEHGQVDDFDTRTLTRMQKEIGEMLNARTPSEIMKWLDIYLAALPQPFRKEYKDALAADDKELSTPGWLSCYVSPTRKGLLQHLRSVLRSANVEARRNDTVGSPLTNTSPKKKSSARDHARRNVEGTKAAKGQKVRPEPRQESQAR